MPDTQLLAAVYQCEIQLEAHGHRVENDDLDEIVTDLKELREDISQDDYFGDEHG